MATRSDRVTVTARSAISLPVPPQAFKWSFQDDEEIGIRDHSREIKRYCAGRRSSFDNWTPIVSAVDLRLRKDAVRKLMRDAHDSFCRCGCTAHKKAEPAKKPTPAPSVSIPVQSTSAGATGSGRSKVEQAQTKRILQQRYVSLDELPATDDDDDGQSGWLLGGLKRMVRRESGRLRSNSLTDLFATAVGSKSHWYRRKGFGGSLASLSGSLSGSMPQLNAMQWNEEDSTPRSLPPEFGVSRVKLDPRTHTPPVRRKSEPLVKFNLENKVVDTYPKAEYDRNGINPKPTSEEMLQIRQEMARYKLIEMEVSSYSRHNTHIFNDFQCGLTRTRMTSNRRLPPVA